MTPISIRSRALAVSKLRRAVLKAAAVGFMAALTLWFLVPDFGRAEDGQEPLSAALGKAYAELQKGVDTWDAATLGRARDLFLGLLVERREPASVLAMSVGLADLRLATLHLTRSAVADAERFVAEGTSYLERAMKADPKSGLAVALYGSILGLDIALHPDRAMTLGMASFSAMSRGVSLEPENPRIHLLQGQSLLYVPEAFGGGAAAAITSLQKALGLFEKEKTSEAGVPSWGLDETYTYLGLAYAKTDPAKSRGFFEKALSVNPAMGLAKSELAKLAKRP
jgi:hypothetical protein